MDRFQGRSTGMWADTEIGVTAITEAVMSRILPSPFSDTEISGESEHCGPGFC